MAFDAYHKWLGIPPADQPPNYYRLLAIGLFEDDSDVIETAADQRMGHLRTFQTGQYSAESQVLLNELSAARRCLLDKGKKTAYDAALRDRMVVANPVQPMAPAPRPLVPVPQAIEPLSIIVTESGAVRHSARKRRSGVGRVASAWLALAVVAIPTAIFVGYLIWAKLESRRRTPLASRPKGRAAARNEPKTTPPPARQPSELREPLVGGSPDGRRHGHELSQGNVPATADLEIQPVELAAPKSDMASTKIAPGGRDASIEPPPIREIGTTQPPSPSPPTQPAAALERQSAELTLEPHSAAEAAKVEKATTASKPRGKRRSARPTTGRNKRSPKTEAAVKAEPLGLRWQAAFAATKVFLPTIGVRPNLAPLTVKGRPTPNGLFAPPPENGFSTIKYALGKKAKSLTFEVGIDDASSNALATQPWFQVLGDDKEIWKSPPIRGKAHMEKCQNLNLESVNVLELRVNCPGKRDGTGTVWFEPMVTWK